MSVIERRYLGTAAWKWRLTANNDGDKEKDMQTRINWRLLFII